jgi:hypothetical protein
MTFEQLDEFLPNGFHDAMIEKIAIDYAQRSADLLMKLWVGTPDSANLEEYRSATLNVTGLGYIAIDSPDPKYPFMRPGAALDVAGYSEDSESFPLEALRPAMPTAVSCYRFFVHDWNAFVHIAAEDVQLSWADS